MNIKLWYRTTYYGVDYLVTMFILGIMVGMTIVW